VEVMAYKYILPEHLKVQEEIPETSFNVSSLQKARLTVAVDSITKQFNAAIKERMKAKNATEVLRWDFTITSLGMQKALLEEQQRQWGYMRTRLGSHENWKQSILFMFGGLIAGSLIVSMVRKRKR
jgi:hypothetical protein